jgi:hypothetical protein
LPEEHGPCKGNVQKFMYDESLGRCRAFTYGGCRGNKNRFASISSCQAACGGEHRPELLEIDPSLGKKEALSTKTSNKTARKTEDLGQQSGSEKKLL